MIRSEILPRTRTDWLCVGAMAACGVAVVATMLSASETASQLVWVSVYLIIGSGLIGGIVAVSHLVRGNLRAALWPAILVGVTWLPMIGLLIGGAVLGLP